MATGTVEPENRSEEMKHLGFINIAAINAFICVSKIYEYAKEKSGPLKSGIIAVESSVKPLSRPAFQKLKSVAKDLLIFFDKEVDVAATKCEQYTPYSVKSVMRQSQSKSQLMIEWVHSLVSKARVVPAVANPNAAKKYGKFVEEQAVKIWLALNHVPIFHKVAGMAVPTAAQWLEKYNCTVKDMSGRGYTVFCYLPTVPLDRIAKAFKGDEARKESGVAEANHEEVDKKSL